jgi:hypothetical protein
MKFLSAKTAGPNRITRDNQMAYIVSYIFVILYSPFSIVRGWTCCWICLAIEADR